MNDARNDTATTDKRSLRRTLRARRRALSAREQRRAAVGVAARLGRLPVWRRARRIGLYLPADGELDPAAVLRRAWAEGRGTWLPVLTAGGGLHFRRLTPRTPLRANGLGLLEPAGARATRCPFAALDLLLLPLVGFDAAGRRLGMGGGFYDRTLAARGRFRRPALVGLAHDCQQLPHLPAQPWDVPLDAVVTGRRVHRFRGGARGAQWG